MFQFVVRAYIQLCGETGASYGKEQTGVDGDARVGAVRGRSQVFTRNQIWTKRDSDTGRFLDQKADSKPFKGVRREK